MLMNCGLFSKTKAASLSALHTASSEEPSLSAVFSRLSCSLSAYVVLGGPYSDGVDFMAFLTSVSYWNSAVSSAGRSGSITKPDGSYSLGL